MRSAGGRASRAAAPRHGRIAALALAAVLAACASRAPAPGWQHDARSAIDAAIAAYLAGDDRTEPLERARARERIGRSGRIDLLARAELMHCAARVASLVFEPCAGFEPLRLDAAAAERAYAAYLAGEPLDAGSIGRLPPAQQAAARAVAGDGDPRLAAASADDPLSRLVASAVLLRAGKATPALAAAAADTASAQGWRRPLLAWLQLQAGLAERAGDTAEAARLRRRIAVVAGER